MSEAPRVRNVCFTVNALDNSVMRLLDPVHPTWKNLRYVVYQREIGSHEHYQGYLELTNGMTYDQIHQFEGLEGAALFRRRGSAKQARHYCMKPVPGCDCDHCRDEASNPTKLEGPFEYGEMSQQGVNADLLEVKRDLEHNVPLKRIARDHFPTWVRHNKSITEYRRIITEKRDFKTKTFLFVGPPGKGKSTLMKILARYVGATVYKVPAKKGSGLYFDDYDGQEVMLLDEFSGATCPPEFFNLLADEHECVLPVHGGAGHQMVSKYLFIASNYAPKSWWSKRTPNQLLQTTRRIDVVFKIGMTIRGVVEMHGMEFMRPLTINSVHFPIFNLN